MPRPASETRQRKQPRHGGAFRRRGTADPAPLLTDADELRRAAKVLAGARNTGQRAAERSAWVWQHVAAMQAEIERLRAAKAADAVPADHHPV
jgi:hypothetical protein